MVNGRKVKKVSFRVQEGDKIEVTESEAPVNDSIEVKDLKLKVLYEDDACMVIDKPSGIAVHPGAGMAPGEITLLSGIAFLFGKRSLPFSPEGVLVHRLDKETTGCILIAKTPEAHNTLQSQFETRTVDKRYLAIVAGIPKLAQAKVDAPIGRSLSDRTKMSVTRSSAPREAQTTYRVLESSAKASLLECELHTGRTHQVRVHLQSIGHPILGDSQYANMQSEMLADEFDIRSVSLHAWKLSFDSPAGGKRQNVEAPVPAAFIRSLEVAGIEWSVR
jgi:23S rRNA pseudouridine1911/1915/1917 synthase